MKVFYDVRDARSSNRAFARQIRWLIGQGALPLNEAMANDIGFVFAGDRGIEDYRWLLARYPHLRDRPDERAPLCRLDSILDVLESEQLNIPTPKTWRLPLDSPTPKDITFPLFVRTATTSWKLGGRVSRVRTPRELTEESDALRRAFQWDAVILARQWLDLATAGQGMYGPIPQEVRIWIVDRVPRAWSFHYLNLLNSPSGFPPSDDDLFQLFSWAAEIGSVFRSRLIAADFARLKRGGWAFIEAGPGSCAGTAHESVFKAVVSMLLNHDVACFNDATGGVH